MKGDYVLVGVVRHSTHPYSDNPEAHVDWVFDGDEINLRDGTGLYMDTKFPLVEDRVSIPRTTEQAKLMVLLGMEWLKNNDPEELTDG